MLWSMLSACESGAPSRTLRGVKPDVVSNAIDATVVVEGAGFLDIPLVALGSRNKASLRTSYQVRVGDVFETDDVERLSTEELAFTLPKGLTPGVYDFVLNPPAGDALQLKAALTVMDGSATQPAARVKLSLETQADGSGESLTERTLFVTESLELFAVLRDEHGELIGESQAVRFTQAPAIGVLSEQYATHTVFSPRLPGDLVLHAETDAAQTADVTLHVQADAEHTLSDYTLSVEDAPAGAGKPLAAEVSRRAGEQLAWYPVVRDQVGNFVLDIPATWNVQGAQSAAPTTAATFNLALSKAGVIEIEARYAGLDPASVRVRVAAGRADRLSLDPDSAQLVAGGPALQFVAGAEDAFGNATQDVGTLTYEVVDGSFGDFVPANSTLTPRRVGSGHLAVHSSYGPQHTSGTIEVSVGPVVRLSLSPDNLQLTADASPVQFEVTGFDAFDNPTSTLGTLTWSVVTGTIASLSVEGEFDPTTAGSGTIGVTSSLGPSATSGSIEVVPGQLSALSIQPQTWAGKVGDATQQFTVTGADADGNAVTATDTGTLSFRVASGTIAAIDAQSGLFTPSAPGQGTIEVTSSSGLSATTQNIVVSPAGATLRVAAIRAPSFVWPGERGARIEVDVVSTDLSEVVITGMGLSFVELSGDASDAFSVVADRANSDRIAAGSTQTLIYYVDVDESLSSLLSLTVTATGEAFPSTGSPFVFARSVSLGVNLSLLSSTLRLTAPVAPADRTCVGGRVSFGADTSTFLPPEFFWRFSGGTVAPGFSVSNKTTAVDFAAVGNFTYSVNSLYLGYPNAAYGTPIYVGRVASLPADTFPAGQIVVTVPSAGQAVALATFPRSDLIALSATLPVRQCNNVAVDSTGHTALTIFSDRGLIHPSADVDALAPGIQVQLTAAGVLGSVPLIAPKTLVEGPTTVYLEYFDASSGAVTAAGDRTFQLSADLQAPTLQWSNPGADCSSACLGSGDPLTFQFSEPMSLTSLSNTKVELFAGISTCTGTATTVTSSSTRTYEPAAQVLYIKPPTRTGTYAIRVQLPTTITDASTKHNGLAAASRCVVYGTVSSAGTPVVPQLTAATVAKFSPDGDTSQDSMTLKVSADAVTSLLRVRITRAGSTVWARLAPVVQAGEYTFVWDGADSSGRIVADGIYGYAVEAINRAGVASAALRGYVEVDSAVRMVSVRRPQ